MTRQRLQIGTFDTEVDAGGEVSNPANKPLSASIGEAGDLSYGRLVEAPSM